MDIDQNIVNSLEYARSNWGKVATLGAVLIVPFIIFLAIVFLGALSNNAAIIITLGIMGTILFIIAAILVQGYFYRVIKSTLAGLDDLPDFDEWGEMFTSGLKVLLVQVVYNIIFGIIAIIPIIVIFLIFGLLGGFLSIFTGALSSSAALTPGALLSSGLLFWGMYLAIFLTYLIMLVVMVLYAIMFPLGIANMAYYDKMSAAFELSQLREKIKDIRWGKAVIWVVAIYFVIIVAVLISYILGLLLVGLILVPLIIIPLMIIFYARSTGLLYLNE
ncbi:MAG: DUF4013 domain-containing protein [Methanobacteriaceae archaeon]|nr:DUF4013 domain-containing protein [Methanobacteriaceae archaeon]